MDYKDYYQILGCSRNANEQEIKRAFRKLAQKYHPDKNPGDEEAERRFKEVNEAYTILSDSDKRSKYDRFGSQWEQYAHTGNTGNFDWSQWAGSGGGGRSRTVTPEEFEQIFGGGGMDGSGFSSFFDALFGSDITGGAGGRGFNPNVGQRTTRRRSTDPEIPVTISLEEAYSGTQRTLQGDDGARFEVKIPPGVKTGSKVRVPSPDGFGHILLKIEVARHKQFRRKGDNLRVTVPVDLYTAILGGEAEIPTFDRPVLFTIPGGTENGKVFRLRNLGMPKLKQPKEHGDLLAEVDIMLPSELSDTEKRLFQQLRDLRTS